MRLDRRKLADDLVELMARCLHYQDRGEPDPMTASYAELVRLPDEIVQRYRNDARFNAQVQRAVASVLHIIADAERDADRVSEHPPGVSHE